MIKETSVVSALQVSCEGKKGGYLPVCAASNSPASGLSGKTKLIWEFTLARL